MSDWLSRNYPGTKQTKDTAQVRSNQQQQQKDIFIVVIPKQKKWQLYDNCTRSLESHLDHMHCACDLSDFPDFLCNCHKVATSSAAQLSKAVVASVYMLLQDNNSTGMTD